MTTQDRVHRAVEQTYGRAGAPTTGKQLAGYSEAQIAAVGGVPFYEADELLGLFGNGRRGAKLASRVVAGHLWSSKLTARRPA